MGLDVIDLRILEKMQNDSSVTQRELAELLHISPATILRRIQYLKENGFIEREVAILNAQSIGSYLQVIVEVTLDKQDSHSQDAFERAIQPMSAVQQCYRVSAGPDFVLMLIVPNMQRYQTLAHQIFTAEYNVRNVRAFFCTQCVKFSTQIPLQEIVSFSEMK